MQSVVKEAVRIIENLGNQDFFVNKYTPIYMFTTENINGVMGSIDVNNKKVLTVSASGDHIFNMLLCGALDVDAYDINYFTKYFFYFKEAAVRVLSYDEFLNFFFVKKIGLNTKVFDEDVFWKKIFNNIRDDEARYFWGCLFKFYGGKVLYNSKLFIKIHYSTKTYVACNNYLANRENYIKLRNVLCSYNYKFYNFSVFDDISSLSNNKYDVIYLSNILDRLICFDEVSCVNKLRDVISSLNGYLNCDGILGMCYLYCYLDEYWRNISFSSIVDPSFRRKFFGESEYFYSVFNGINDLKGRVSKNKDALMLVKKKNNN